MRAAIRRLPLPPRSPDRLTAVSTEVGSVAGTEPHTEAAEAETAGAQTTGRSPRRSRPSVPPATVARVLFVVLLLVLDLGMCAAYGAYQAIETPTYHLDGAFQTASGLLRLKAGDLPGRDFFPYLGIGPVFLLYPSFLLTGGILASSVFSAWSVTALVLGLLVGVVFACALRARSVTAVLIGSGVVLVMLVLGSARFAFLPPTWQEILAPVFAVGIPGNSLRPVRAAAPLLLLSVSILSIVRLPRTAGLIVTGAAFGVILACWSNDFALAPSAVVLVFLLNHGIRKRRWRLKEVATLAAAMGAAFLVSGFVATGGHYVEYAVYNFHDVLGDQYWYFGQWSPEDHVSSPGPLLRFIVAIGSQWGIPLLVALGILVLIRPTLRWSAIAALGWAAFTGGTVAVLGGHLDDYYLPFRVWTVVAGAASAIALVRFVLVLLIRLARLIPSVRSIRAPVRLPRARAVVRVVGAVAAVALLAAGGVKELRSYTAQRAATAADQSQSFVPALGGYLPTVFDAHLAAAGGEGTFIEEYAGLWTALRGPNQNVKEDAVIHALGDERSKFARSVSSGVGTVVTTAPYLSGEWVSWNISANWWFYRTLFHHFIPTQSSPNTIVWKRSDTAAAPISGTCTVAADGQSVAVRSPATGLHELTVQYRGPGTSSRGFSMLRNDIDGALDAYGSVALDPSATSQSVPVNLQPTGNKRFELRNTPDRRLTTITDCSIATVPFPTGSEPDAIYGWLWTVGTTPMAFTDVNYLNGLARTGAAFIVDVSAPNAAAYTVGSQVKLGNGEVRQVLAANGNFNQFVVYLSGGVLPQSILKTKTPVSPVR